MGYLYNAILFSQKNNDRCNMDEPGNVKWKQQDSKDCTLYFIYICLGKANLRDKKVDQWLIRIGGRNSCDYK